MTQTILFIRHAEKPNGNGSDGVDVSGAADAKSLTPVGWQRAGAWTELFAPSLAPPQLPEPTAIFASSPSGHHDDENGADEAGSRSRRPLETITPLAAKLGIAVDLRYSRGNEADLAQTISGTAGVVLVCWQHEAILEIAGALTPAPAGLPTAWPGDRFNVILKFVRPNNASAWTIAQIVPKMLIDDSESAI